MKKTKFFLRQLIAIFLLTVFSVETLFAQTPAVFSTQNSVEKISVPAQDFWLPKETGKLENSYGKSPALYFIQDPHGHYEGQKNIQKVLEFLQHKIGFKTLFLEGGAGTQDLKELEFFKEPEFNRKAANLLAREAEIGGAELFLLEKENRNVQAYGIEDPSIYLRNLDLFVRIQESRVQSDAYLTRSFEKLMTDVSRADPDLQKFLREWLNFEMERTDFVFYLSSLQKNALERLELDLKDPRRQIVWPMLVRYSELKRREPLLDEKAAEAEKTKLIQWAKEKKISREIVNGLKSGEIHDRRAFWENFYAAASAEGFDFKTYPALALHEGFQILRAEMESRPFFEETEKLRDAILESFREKNPVNGKLSDNARKLVLLRKILRLEVTPQELQKIKSHLIQSGFISRLPADIAEIYRNSLEFYQLAEQRDETMLDEILKHKPDSRNPAVVIAGGFHAPGMTKRLEERGISYAVISPHLPEIESPEKYIAAMTGEKPKPDFQYFAVRNAAWPTPESRWQGRLPRALSKRREDFRQLIFEKGRGQGAALSVRATRAELRAVNEDILDSAEIALRLIPERHEDQAVMEKLRRDLELGRPISKEFSEKVRTVLQHKEQWLIPFRSEVDDEEFEVKRRTTPTPGEKGEVEKKLQRIETYEVAFSRLLAYLNSVKSYAKIPLTEFDPYELDRVSLLGAATDPVRLKMSAENVRTVGDFIHFIIERPETFGKIFSGSERKIIVDSLMVAVTAQHRRSVMRALNQTASQEIPIEALVLYLWDMKHVLIESEIKRLKTGFAVHDFDGLERLSLEPRPFAAMFPDPDVRKIISDIFNRSEIRSAVAAEGTRFFELNAWLENILEDADFDRNLIKYHDELVEQLGHDAESILLTNEHIPREHKQNAVHMLFDQWVGNDFGPLPDGPFHKLLQAVALYILDNGLAPSETQLNVPRALDLLEKLVQRYNRTFSDLPELSIPLLYILSLSTYYPEETANAFVRLRSRFHLLPGEYGYRTIALDLTLTGMHLRGDFIKSDQVDIQRVLPNLEAAVKLLEAKAAGEPLSHPMSLETEQFMKMGAVKLLLTLQPVLTDQPWVETVKTTLSPFNYVEKSRSDPDVFRDLISQIRGTEEVAQFKRLYLEHRESFDRWVGDFLWNYRFSMEWAGLQYYFFDRIYEALRSYGKKPNYEKMLSALANGDGSALAHIPIFLKSGEVAVGDVYLSHERTGVVRARDMFSHNEGYRKRIEAHLRRVERDLEDVHVRAELRNAEILEIRNGITDLGMDPSDFKTVVFPFVGYADVNVRMHSKISFVEGLVQTFDQLEDIYLIDSGYPDENMKRIQTDLDKMAGRVRPGNPPRIHIVREDYYSMKLPELSGPSVFVDKYPGDLHGVLRRNFRYLKSIFSRDYSLVISVPPHGHEFPFPPGSSRRVHMPDYNEFRNFQIFRVDDSLRAMMGNSKALSQAGYLKQLLLKSGTPLTFDGVGRFIEAWKQDKEGFVAKWYEKVRRTDPRISEWMKDYTLRRLSIGTVGFIPGTTGTRKHIVSFSDDDSELSYEEKTGKLIVKENIRQELRRRDSFAAALSAAPVLMARGKKEKVIRANDVKLEASEQRILFHRELEAIWKAKIAQPRPGLSWNELRESEDFEILLLINNLSEVEGVLLSSKIENRKSVELIGLAVWEERRGKGSLLMDAYLNEIKTRGWDTPETEFSLVSDFNSKGFYRSYFRNRKIPVENENRGAVFAVPLSVLQTITFPGTRPEMRAVAESLQVKLEASPAIMAREGVGRVVEVAPLSLNKEEQKHLIRKMIELDRAAFEVSSQYRSQHEQEKRVLFEYYLDSKDGRTFLLLNDQNQMTGFLISYGFQSKKIQVARMAALPDTERGKGTLLLDVIFEHARKENAESVSWSSRIKDETLGFYGSYIRRHGMVSDNSIRYSYTLSRVEIQKWQPLDYSKARPEIRSETSDELLDGLKYLGYLERDLERYLQRYPNAEISASGITQLKQELAVFKPYAAQEILKAGLEIPEGVNIETVRRLKTRSVKILGKFYETIPLISITLPKEVEISQRSFSLFNEEQKQRYLPREVHFTPKNYFSQFRYRIQINGRSYYFGKNHYIHFRFPNGDESYLYDAHNIFYGFLGQYLESHPGVIENKTYVHYDAHADDSDPAERWGDENARRLNRYREAFLERNDWFSMAQIHNIGNFLDGAHKDLLAGWHWIWTVPGIRQDTLLSRLFPQNQDFNTFEYSSRGGIGNFDLDMITLGRGRKIPFDNAWARYQKHKSRLEGQLPLFNLTTFFISDDRYIEPVAALEMFADFFPEFAAEKIKQPLSAAPREEARTKIRKTSVKQIDFTYLGQLARDMMWQLEKYPDAEKRSPGFRKVVGDLKAFLPFAEPSRILGVSFPDMDDEQIEALQERARKILGQFYTAKPLISMNLPPEVEVIQEKFSLFNQAELKYYLPNHLLWNTENYQSVFQYHVEINGQSYWIGKDKYLRFRFPNGDESFFYDSHNLFYAFAASFLERNPEVKGAVKNYVHYDAHSDDRSVSFWGESHVRQMERHRKEFLRDGTPFSVAQLYNIGNFLDGVRRDLLKNWRWMWVDLNVVPDLRPAIAALFPRNVHLQDFIYPVRGGIGDVDLDMIVDGDGRAVPFDKAWQMYLKYRPRLLDQLPLFNLTTFFISDDRYIEPVAALEMFADLFPKIAAEKVKQPRIILPRHELRTSNSEDSETKINRWFQRARIRHRDFDRTKLGMHVPTQYTHFMEVVNAFPRPDGKPFRVFDAGSGQGVFALRLAMARPNALITGVESERQLKQESEKILAEAVRDGDVGQNQVEFFEGNFNDPQWQEKIAEADYVYYYDSGSKNSEALKQTLIKHMRPGSRLVMLHSTSGSEFLNGLLENGQFTREETPGNLWVSVLVRSEVRAHAAEPNRLAEDLREAPAVLENEILGKVVRASKIPFSSARELAVLSDELTKISNQIFTKQEGIFSTAAGWYAKVASGDHEILLLVNREQKITGFVLSTNYGKWQKVYMERIGTLENGQSGKGYLLLDAYFKELYRHNVQEISWSVKAGSEAEQFYRHYLDSRQVTYAVEDEQPLVFRIFRNDMENFHRDRFPALAAELGTIGAEESERSARHEVRMEIYDYVRQMFSRAEVEFKDEHILTQRGIFRPALNIVIDPLVSRIPSAGKVKVIDMGSGQGGVVFAFAVANRDAEILGIEYDKTLYDDSVKVLTAAGEAPLTRHMKNRVRFEKGDFNDSKFAAEIAQADFIYYWESGTANEPGLLDNLIKNMKPGAKLLIVKTRSTFIKMVESSGYFFSHRSSEETGVYSFERNEKPFNPPSAPLSELRTQSAEEKRFFEVFGPGEGGRIKYQAEWIAGIFEKLTAVEKRTILYPNLLMTLLGVKPLYYQTEQGSPNPKDLASGMIEKNLLDGSRLQFYTDERRLISLLHAGVKILESRSLFESRGLLQPEDRRAIDQIETDLRARSDEYLDHTLSLIQRITERIEKEQKSQRIQEGLHYFFGSFFNHSREDMDAYWKAIQAGRPALDDPRFKSAGYYATSIFTERPAAENKWLRRAQASLDYVYSLLAEKSGFQEASKGYLVRSEIRSADLVDEFIDLAKTGPKDWTIGIEDNRREESFWQDAGGYWEMLRGFMKNAPDSFSLHTMRSKENGKARVLAIGLYNYSGKRAGRMTHRMPQKSVEEKMRELTATFRLSEALDRAANPSEVWAPGAKQDLSRQVQKDLAVLGSWRSEYQRFLLAEDEPYSIYAKFRRPVTTDFLNDYHEAVRLAIYGADLFDYRAIFSGHDDLSLGEMSFFNDDALSAKWIEAQKGKKVLDIGAVAGWWIRDLRNAGSEAWGLDADEEAIRRSSELGIRDFMTFGDARFMPYGDAAFDTVYSRAVIASDGVKRGKGGPMGYWDREEIPAGAVRRPVDVLAAFHEIHRVLKTGGRAYLDDAFYPEDIWQILSLVPLSIIPSGIPDFYVFGKKAGRSEIRAVEKAKGQGEIFYEKSQEMKSRQKDFGDLVADILKPLAEKSVVTREEVLELLTARQEEIFAMQRSLKETASAMALYDDYDFGFSSYFNLNIIDSPDCGLCRESAEAVVDGVKKIGFKKNLNPDVITFKNAFQTIHAYARIETSEGLTVVDLAAGQMQDNPKGQGTIRVMPYMEYIAEVSRIIFMPSDAKKEEVKSREKQVGDSFNTLREESFRSKRRLAVTDFIGNNAVRYTKTTKVMEGNEKILVGQFEMLMPEVFGNFRKMLLIGNAPTEIEALLRSNPKAEAYAVDIHEAQTRRISEYFENRPEAARIRLFRADAASLDPAVFESGSFDFIYASGLDDDAFFNPKEAGEVLPEMMKEEYRLLAPGGVLFHVTENNHQDYVKDGRLVPAGKNTWGVFRKPARQELRNAYGANFSNRRGLGGDRKGLNIFRGFKDLDGMYRGRVSDASRRELRTKEQEEAAFKKNAKIEQNPVDAFLRRMLLADRGNWNAWFQGSRDLSSRLELFRPIWSDPRQTNDPFPVQLAIARMHFRDKYGFQSLGYMATQEERGIRTLETAEDKAEAVKLFEKLDRSMQRRPQAAAVLKLLQRPVGLGIAKKIEGNGGDQWRNSYDGGYQGVNFIAIPLEVRDASNAVVDYEGLVTPQTSLYGPEKPFIAFDRLFLHELAHSVWGNWKTAGGFSNFFMLPLKKTATRKFFAKHAEKLKITVRGELADDQLPLAVFLFGSKIYQNHIQEILSEMGQAPDAAIILGPEQMPLVERHFISKRSADSALEFLVEGLSLYWMDPQLVRDKDPLLAEFFEAIYDWSPVLRAEWRRGHVAEAVLDLVESGKGPANWRGGFVQYFNQAQELMGFLLTLGYEFKPSDNVLDDSPDVFQMFQNLQERYSKLDATGFGVRNELRSSSEKKSPKDFELGAYLKEISKKEDLNSISLKRFSARIVKQLGDEGVAILENGEFDTGIENTRENAFFILLRNAAVYILEENAQPDAKRGKILAYLNQLERLIRRYNREYPESPRLSVPVLLTMPLTVFFQEEDEEVFVKFRGSLHRLPRKYKYRTLALDLFLTGMHLRGDLIIDDYADFQRIEPNLKTALEALSEKKTAASMDPEEKKFLEAGILKFFLTAQPVLVDSERWPGFSGIENDPFYYVSKSSTAGRFEIIKAIRNMTPVNFIRGAFAAHPEVLRGILKEFKEKPLDYQQGFVALQFNLFWPYYLQLRSRRIRESLETSLKAFGNGDWDRRGRIPVILRSEVERGANPVAADLGSVFENEPKLLKAVNLQLARLDKDAENILSARSEVRAKGRGEIFYEHIQELKRKEKQFAKNPLGRPLSHTNEQVMQAYERLKAEKRGFNPTREEFASELKVSIATLHAYLNKLSGKGTKLKLAYQRTVKDETWVSTYEHLKQIQKGKAPARAEFAASLGISETTFYRNLKRLAGQGITFEFSDPIGVSKELIAVVDAYNRLKERYKGLTPSRKDLAHELKTKVSTVERRLRQLAKRGKPLEISPRRSFTLQAFFTAYDRLRELNDGVPPTALELAAELQVHVSTMRIFVRGLIKKKILSRRPRKAITQEKLIQAYSDLIDRKNGAMIIAADLAKVLQVDTSTVHRYLRQLRKEGVDLKTRGKGRVPKLSSNQLMQVYYHLREEMKGVDPSPRQLIEELGTSRSTTYRVFGRIRPLLWSRDDLFKKYLPLMERMSRLYAWRSHETVQDPLVFLSAAAIGFQETLKKFSPNDPHFEKLAERRMYARIMDQIRKESSRSRNVIKSLKKLNQAAGELWNEGNTNPSIAELARRSKLPEKTVRDLFVFKHPPVFLSRPLDNKDSTADLASTLEEKNNDVQDQVADLIDRYGRGLDFKERYILEKYHLDPLRPNMKTIASELGITESRASQIHKSAIRKLKNHYELENGIKDELVNRHEIRSGFFEKPILMGKLHHDFRQIYEPKGLKVSFDNAFAPDHYGITVARPEGWQGKSWAGNLLYDDGMSLSFINLDNLDRGHAAHIKLTFLGDEILSVDQSLEGRQPGFSAFIPVDNALKSLAVDEDGMLYAVVDPAAIEKYEAAVDPAGHVRPSLEELPVRLISEKDLKVPPLKILAAPRSELRGAELLAQRLAEIPKDTPMREAVSRVFKNQEDAIPLQQYFQKYPGLFQHFDMNLRQALPVLIETHMTLDQLAKRLEDLEKDPELSPALEFRREYQFGQKVQLLQALLISDEVQAGVRDFLKKENGAAFFKMKRTGQAIAIFLAARKTREAALAFLKAYEPKNVYGSILVAGDQAAENGTKITAFWYYLEPLYRELIKMGDSSEEAGRRLAYLANYLKDSTDLRLPDDSGMEWQQWLNEDSDLKEYVDESLVTEWAAFLKSKPVRQELRMGNADDLDYRQNWNVPHVIAGFRKTRKEFDPAFRRFVEEEIVLPLASSLKGAEEIHRIVELGSGGGQLWDWAKPAFEKRFPGKTPMSSWLQTDLHERLLALPAQNPRRTKKMDWSKRLPFDDNSLPGIVSLSALDVMPLPELPKFMKEAARVLRPGAAFVAMLDLIPNTKVEISEAKRQGFETFPYFIEIQPRLLPKLYEPNGLLIYDWEKIKEAEVTIPEEVDLYRNRWNDNAQDLFSLMDGNLESRRKLMGVSQWLFLKAIKYGALKEIYESRGRMHIERIRKAAEQAGLESVAWEPLVKTYEFDRSEFPQMRGDENFLYWEAGHVITGDQGGIPQNRIRVYLSLDRLVAVKPVRHEIRSGEPDNKRRFLGEAEQNGEVLQYGDAGVLLLGKNRAGKSTVAAILAGDKTSHYREALALNPWKLAVANLGEIQFVRDGNQYKLIGKSSSESLLNKWALKPRLIGQTNLYGGDNSVQVKYVIFLGAEDEYLLAYPIPQTMSAHGATLDSMGIRKLVIPVQADTENPSAGIPLSYYESVAAQIRQFVESHEAGPEIREKSFLEASPLSLMPVAAILSLLKNENWEETFQNYVLGLDSKMRQRFADEILPALYSSDWPQQIPPKQQVLLKIQQIYRISGYEPSPVNVSQDKYQVIQMRYAETAEAMSRVVLKYGENSNAKSPSIYSKSTSKADVEFRFILLDEVQSKDQFSFKSDKTGAHILLVGANRDEIEVLLDRYPNVDTLYLVDAQPSRFEDWDSFLVQRRSAGKKIPKVYGYLMNVLELPQGLANRIDVIYERGAFDGNFYSKGQIQQLASEIVRVLKPGGVYLPHTSGIVSHEVFSAAVQFMDEEVLSSTHHLHFARKRMTRHELQQSLESREFNRFKIRKLGNERKSFVITEKAAVSTILKQVERLKNLDERINSNDYLASIPDESPSNEFYFRHQLHHALDYDHLFREVSNPDAVNSESLRGLIDRLDATYKVLEHLLQQPLNSLVQYSNEMMLEISKYSSPAAWEIAGGIMTSSAKNQFTPQHFDQIRVIMGEIKSIHDVVSGVEFEDSHEPRPEIRTVLEVAREMTAKILPVSRAEALIDLILPAALAQEAVEPLTAEEKDILVDYYTALFRSGGKAVLPAEALQTLESGESGNSLFDYFDLVLKGAKRANKKSAVVYVAGQGSQEIKNRVFSADHFRLNPEFLISGSKIFSFSPQSEAVVAERLKREALAVSFAKEPEEKITASIPAFLLDQNALAELSAADRLEYLSRLTQLQLLAAEQLKDSVKEMPAFLAKAGIQFELSAGGFARPSAQSLLSEQFTRFMAAQLAERAA